ncbi:UNVERIFIED_CONTAM: hypothetical protein RMT77_015709 [Armadillidium vulgare]
MFGRKTVMVFGRKIGFKIQIVIYLLQMLHALGEISGSQIWKAITMDQIKLVNITAAVEVQMSSRIMCALLANNKGTNYFCYDFGICKLSHVSPCFSLGDDSNNENYSTCYVSQNFFEWRSRTENDGMFHKYAGCVWKSAKKEGPFWKRNELCEEERGLLISFEKFPTKKDFTDYVAQIKIGTSFVGFFRNGSKSDFKWLTGTTLNRSSFLWLDGEPSSDDVDFMCGEVYHGMLDDVVCEAKFQRNSYCQILLP